MPVPGATANYLKNTTGGAFSAQTQGGTILSNQTTGDAITKALALKDNAADFTDIPTPKKSATTGSYGTEVVNAQGSNGTFAYNGGTAQGTRFPMIGYSTNLGGYANTAILSPGAEPENMVAKLFTNSFTTLVPTRQCYSEEVDTPTLDTSLMATPNLRSVLLTCLRQPTDTHMLLPEHIRVLTCMLPEVQIETVQVRQLDLLMRQPTQPVQFRVDWFCKQYLRLMRLTSRLTHLWQPMADLTSMSTSRLMVNAL